MQTETNAVQTLKRIDAAIQRKISDSLHNTIDQIERQMRLPSTQQKLVKEPFHPDIQQLDKLNYRKEEFEQFQNDRAEGENYYLKHGLIPLCVAPIGFWSLVVDNIPSLYWMRNVSRNNTSKAELHTFPKIALVMAIMLAMITGVVLGAITRPLGTNLWIPLAVFTAAISFGVFNFFSSLLSIIVVICMPSKYVNRSVFTDRRDTVYEGSNTREVALSFPNVEKHFTDVKNQLHDMGEQVSIVAVEEGIRVGKMALIKYCWEEQKKKKISLSKLIPIRKPKDPIVCTIYKGCIFFWAQSGPFTIEQQLIAFVRKTFTL